MATGLDMLFGMRTDGLDPVRAPRDPTPCALPRCILMACRVAPLHSWADWHGCEAAAPRAMCSPAAGLASHTCWQALRHLALVAERLQQRKRRSTSTPSSDASIFDPSRWSREPRRRLPSRPAPGESRSPPSPGALGRAGEPSVPLYKAAVATSGPFGRVDMCAPGRKGQRMTC